LFEHVWGDDFFGSDNTVMVHIRRLREKIEADPSKPSFLITVKGLGYKLQTKGETR
jgi:DNA-binding response OmpR family regulator